MKVLISLAMYISVGYVVGIPLAALLDYVTYDARWNKKNASTKLAILAWPSIIVIALLILPICVRDWLHSKLPKDNSGAK